MAGGTACARSYRKTRLSGPTMATQVNLILAFRKCCTASAIASPTAMYVISGTIETRQQTAYPKLQVSAATSMEVLVNDVGSDRPTVAVQLRHCPPLCSSFRARRAWTPLGPVTPLSPLRYPSPTLADKSRDRNPLADGFRDFSRRKSYVSADRPAVTLVLERLSHRI